jgi:hypothetical protein
LDREVTFAGIGCPFVLDRGLESLPVGSNCRTAGPAVPAWLHDPVGDVSSGCWFDDRRGSRRDDSEPIGDRRVMEHCDEPVDRLGQVAPAVVMERDHDLWVEDVSCGAAALSSVSSAPSNSHGSLATPTNRIATSTCPTRVAISRTTSTEAVSPLT